LQVTVGASSNPDCAITSGGGASTIPGTAKGSTSKLAVEIEFIPGGAGKGIDGSIDITSDAASGNSSATVELKGQATQKTLAAPTPSPIPNDSVSLLGTVRGGISQAPISGSVVTIDAAGNAYSAGANPLGVATTDASGGFRLS
jgi:hypothetical protein